MADEQNDAQSTPIDEAPGDGDWQDDLIGNLGDFGGQEKYFQVADEPEQEVVDKEDAPEVIANDSQVTDGGPPSPPDHVAALQSQYDELRSANAQLQTQLQTLMQMVGGTHDRNRIPELAPSAEPPRDASGDMYRDVLARGLRVHLGLDDGQQLPEHIIDNFATAAALRQIQARSKGWDAPEIQQRIDEAQLTAQRSLEDYKRGTATERRLAELEKRYQDEQVAPRNHAADLHAAEREFAGADNYPSYTPTLKRLAGSGDAVKIIAREAVRALGGWDQVESQQLVSWLQSAEAQLAPVVADYEAAGDDERERTLRMLGTANPVLAEILKVYTPATTEAKSDGSAKLQKARTVTPPVIKRSSGGSVPSDAPPADGWSRSDHDIEQQMARFGRQMGLLRN